jgi:cellulose synthase/poly-beta-1,6-N-acetylglucosamine synthase-like glycosyltransferase
MAQTPHGYFCILDVDFVPPADFLRRCMAVMLGDPGLAFVQARLDFLNTEENLLTRAQVIMLDYHYGLEQPTRCWAGQVMPLNGTCGIWRREAIEAAGGWSGSTVTEDWDLSYRAWMKGWRGTFVTTVTASGELPSRLRIWMAQQRRWATGIGEVALKILPSLIGNRGLTAEERRGGLFPLALWVGQSVFVATLFPAISACLLKPAISWPFGLAVYAVYLTAWAALFAGMLVARRTVRRSTPFWRFLIDYQIVPYMIMYTSWENLRSVPATLFGRRRTFVRTPKQGSMASPP